MARQVPFTVSRDDKRSLLQQVVDDVALYDDEPVPASIPATVFWVGNAH